MTILEITITPQIAEKMLSVKDENFRNRPLNKNIVEMYAEDMKNGKWMANNGETIKLLEKTEAVGDGQHRLRAIIESGVTLKLPVAYNVPPAAIKTVDIGMKRPLSHALTIVSPNVDKAIAPIVTEHWAYSHNKLAVGASSTSHKRKRSDELELFIKNEQAYNEALQFARKINKESGNGMTVTEIAGLYMYLTVEKGHDKELVKDFFHNLANSERNGETIFSRTLNELIARKKTKGMERKKLLMACWNAMMQGRRTKLDHKTEWFL